MFLSLVSFCGFITLQLQSWLCFCRFIATQCFPLCLLNSRQTTDFFRSGDRADARTMRPYFSPLPVMVVSFLQYGIAKSSKSSNFAKLAINFEEFADFANA